MGFVDKVKGTLKDADEKLGNAIDKEKLDSKIRDEERAIEKYVAIIGKKVVESLKDGKEIDKSSFSEEYQNVLDSEARIEEFKKQKNDLD